MAGRALFPPLTAATSGPPPRYLADDDQDALLGVLKTGLQVNAVGPHIHVVLGRQITLAPVFVLVEPDLLQPRNRRGRQASTANLTRGGLQATSCCDQELPASRFETAVRARRQIASPGGH